MDKAVTVVPLLNTKQKLATPSSGTTLYVDYLREKQTLEVAFRPDKVYHYFEVTEDVWKKYKVAVEQGESSGEFVNYQIKPFYPYIRVR